MDLYVLTAFSEGNPGLESRPGGCLTWPSLFVDFLYPQVERRYSDLAITASLIQPFKFIRIFKTLAIKSVVKYAKNK